MMAVAARLVKDRRGGMVWWSLGIVALVLVTVALYPTVEGSAEFDELFETLPESIRVMTGYQADVPITSPAGYLHARLFSTLLPLLVLVFTIGGGAAAIGGSEEAGRLEPILANPVSRSRIYLERYSATLGLLITVGAVFAVSLLVLGLPFSVLEDLNGPGLLAACASALALALLHGTLAYAIGAGTGRRGQAIGVATAVAVAGYLIQTILPMTGVPDWVLWLTPWHPYLDQNMLASGPAPLALLIPLALTVPLFVAGWWTFTHRDLR